jgi:hypothetical protein
MRKGVVGRRGTNIPIIPTPVKIVPAMTSVIWIGLFKVFLAGVTSFTSFVKVNINIRSARGYTILRDHPRSKIIRPNF